MKNKHIKTKPLTAAAGEKKKKKTLSLSVIDTFIFLHSLCRSLKNVATLALDSLISLIKAEVHRWQVAPEL